jgi:hypothetical protein
MIHGSNPCGSTIAESSNGKTDVSEASYLSSNLSSAAKSTWPNWIRPFPAKEGNVSPNLTVDAKPS